MAKEEREYLIIYLDDDGKTSKAYSSHLDIKDGLVSFNTEDNAIKIPVQRLLKIKEKIKGEKDVSG